MKKKYGFSVAELTVVIIILAMICSFCVPTIIKESAAKIRTTQYYAAYKTLADGTKHVKLNSPTHDLSVIRGGKFRVNACDLFADTYSVTLEKGTRPVYIDGELTEIQKDMSSKMICPDGSLPSDGKCVGKTIATGDRCPDGTLPVCFEGDSCGDNENIYCSVLPQLLNNYAFCDDYTYKDMDDSDWSYGTTEIPEDFYSNSEAYGLEISDKTNFDIETPNFTTLNGMRFFGLDRYPAEQFCEPDLEVTSFKKAESEKCLQYKTVYIDVNGKSGSMKNGEPCKSACSTNAGLNEYAEIGDDANKCLECMRSNFGIYKFLLYNDGRIEPLTNRAEAGDERVRFILSYVKNGEVIQVDEQFETYQDARDYKFDGDETFTVLKETSLGSGGDFNKQAFWATEEVTHPCKTEDGFTKHQCQIKLITPEMQLSQSVRAE